MRMNKTLTVAIAVAAVAMMITCCLVPAVNTSVSDRSSDTAAYEDSGKDITYVALGDSMTAGYGLSGYYDSGFRGFIDYDVEDIYPQYLAGYLKGLGYDVDYNELAWSGARTTDVRAMLDPDFTGKDDYPGDKNTYFEFFKGESNYTTYMYDALNSSDRYKEFCEGYIDTYCEPKTIPEKWDMLCAFYTEQLSNADIVTISFQWDFGLAFTEIIDSAASGKHLNPDFIDADFTLYMDKDLVEMIESLKASLLEYILSLAESMGADISGVLEFIDNMVTYTAYTTLGYCSNMDAISEWIYERNPDAKIVIVDAYNVFRGLYIDITDELKISVSDLYGYILDFCQVYTEYLSPYAEQNYFVEIDGTPTMLGYEFIDCDTEDITDDAKAAVYWAFTDIKYDRDDSIEAYEDFDKNGHFTEFLREIMSSQDIELSFFTDGGLDGFQERINEKNNAAMSIIAYEDTVVYSDDDTGSLTVSREGSDPVIYDKSECAILSIYLLAMQADGILAHPSMYGHQQIVAAVEDVFEEQGVLSGKDKITYMAIEYVSDYVQDQIIDAKEQVVDILEGVKLGVSEYVGEYAEGAAEDLAELRDWLLSVGVTDVSYIDDLIAGLATLDVYVDTVLDELIDEVAEMFDTAAEFIDDNAVQIYDIIMYVYDNIEAIENDVKDTIYNAVSALSEDLADAILEIIDDISDMLNEILGITALTLSPSAEMY